MGGDEYMGRMTAHICDWTRLAEAELHTEGQQANHRVVSCPFDPRCMYKSMYNLTVWRQHFTLRLQCRNHHKPRWHWLFGVLELPTSGKMTEEW